jgi:putative ABC transport system substrate-binding protein
VARAQQPSAATIGFLHSASPGPSQDLVEAFLQDLGERGYAVGRNLQIKYRWAEGQFNQLPLLAADLIKREVAVLVAIGPPAAKAAKVATTTIPIVFTSGDDPVRVGLVASLNRPGGNVTGVSLVIGELMAKRFELLAELVPSPATIAVLLNPSNAVSETDTKQVQSAAQARGRKLALLHASNAAEIDAAFASLAERGAGAVLIGTDIFFSNRSNQLVALANRYRVPTMFQWRASVVEGGLVSYGISRSEPYRQAASYTARILKGEKPADLPVIQPTRFELAINLKAAKALGISVPPTLLTRADEVIE